LKERQGKFIIINGDSFNTSPTSLPTPIVDGLGLGLALGLALGLGLTPLKIPPMI